jgi:hypothetical protein
MRSYPTHASVYGEIEMVVAGTWYPPEKDTDDCPGHGAYAEADEVLSFFLLIREVGGGYTQVDLLKGIDKASPAYSILLGNILSALSDEADEALAQEEPE